MINLAFLLRDLYWVSLPESVVSVPALKGEEKNQTHTQVRFLVILTVRHIFLLYAK